MKRARERLRDNPKFIAELDRRGRERSLVYTTLLLTGLRRGELASITLGQCDLDGATPLIRLNAADEKNRKGTDIPLQRDLAVDLVRSSQMLNWQMRPRLSTSIVSTTFCIRKQPLSLSLREVTPLNPSRSWEYRLPIPSFRASA